MLVGKGRYYEALGLLAGFDAELTSKGGGAYFTAQRLAIETAIDRRGASLPTAGTALRLAKLGSLFYAPVTIGASRSVAFVVDTGATDVVLSRRLLADAKPNDRLLRGHATVTTADNRRVAGDTVLIETLSVGPFRLKNVRAFVCDGCIALLGQTVLKRFDLLSSRARRGIHDGFGPHPAGALNTPAAPMRPARPLRWIGRRSYGGRFAAANRDVLPVCIHAGALPEGAPTESFVDDDSRGMFHNAGEYRALHPDAPSGPAVYCAPRIEQGEALEAVRGRLAARAGLDAGAAPAPGRLIGNLERVDHEVVVGWACDEAAPDRAVRLQVLAGEALLGEVLANRFRGDLLRAGIGDGRHGFSFSLPGGLAVEVRDGIEVRRVSDGQPVPGAPRGMRRLAG